MKLRTTPARACIPLLPAPLPFGEARVREQRLGEGPGMRVLRLGEGAQLTRELEATIASNVTEILET